MTTFTRFSSSPHPTINPFSCITSRKSYILLPVMIMQ
uniref:Uncharacterized protein n=1 Tax=Anguilla anguilla TaxID=7936 RepID=A0A0E9SML5_ANGAN